MLKINKALDIKLFSRRKDVFIDLCQKIVSQAEFQETKQIIENNVSRDHESVFDHTIHVFIRIQELLVLDFLQKESRHLANSYFSTKIGRFTRTELLLVSSLLHDLGKSKTLTTEEDKTTAAPGHEIKSIEIAKIILNKLNFKEDEISYISRVISLHSGYTLRFLKYLMNLSNSQLTNAIRSIFLMPEISFYMIADNESAKIFKEYKEFLLNSILTEKFIYKDVKVLLDIKKTGLLIQKVLQNLKETSKPWPLETRLFHLSEEVGELHDIYLRYSGAKDREQSLVDMQIALNDIFLETLGLYDNLGIDINQSLKMILKEDEK